jgi:hypothetical protein
MNSFMEMWKFTIKMDLFLGKIRFIAEDDMNMESESEGSLISAMAMNTMVGF